MDVYLLLATARALMCDVVVHLVNTCRCLHVFLLPTDACTQACSLRETTEWLNSLPSHISLT